MQLLPLEDLVDLVHVLDVLESLGANDKELNDTDALKQVLSRCRDVADVLDNDSSYHRKTAAAFLRATVKRYSHATDNL